MVTLKGHQGQCIKHLRRRVVIKDAFLKTGLHEQEGADLNIRWKLSCTLILYSEEINVVSRIQTDP